MSGPASSRQLRLTFFLTGLLFGLAGLAGTLTGSFSGKSLFIAAAAPLTMGVGLLLFDRG